jgi:signal transduction histidine kinase
LTDSSISRFAKAFRSFGIVPLPPFAVDATTTLEGRSLSCGRKTSGRPETNVDTHCDKFRLEQDALRRVAVLVARGAPPDVLYKAVTAEVSKVLESEITMIGRYEADSTFTYLAVVGEGFPMSTIGDRFALGGNNLATNILRSGHSESMSYDNASGAIVSVARMLGLCSGVGTPIVVEGRIWGAMLACWTRPQSCPPDAVRRIADITELVATTIANAESRAALVESRARVVAASDETRRRIQRDLHDGAQQHLVTIALKLRTSEESVPPEIARLLDEVALNIEEVLIELRELAHGLRPPMLAEGGLRPALEGLARRAPIPIRLEVQVPCRLPERIEVAAYYVVAEALTNVAKHAHASTAHIDVTLAGGAVTVRVADDGVGGADPARGSGLIGLRDRVEALGGMIAFNSPPGGTVITASLPFRRPSQNAG